MFSTSLSHESRTLRFLRPNSGGCLDVETSRSRPRRLVASIWNDLTGTPPVERSGTSVAWVSSFFLLYSDASIDSDVCPFPGDWVNGCLLRHRTNPTRFVQLQRFLQKRETCHPARDASGWSLACKQGATGLQLMEAAGALNLPSVCSIVLKTTSLLQQASPESSHRHCSSEQSPQGVR